MCACMYPRTNVCDVYIRMILDPVMSCLFVLLTCDCCWSPGPLMWVQYIPPVCCAWVLFDSCNGEGLAQPMRTHEGVMTALLVGVFSRLEMMGEFCCWRRGRMGSWKKTGFLRSFVAHWFASSCRGARDSWIVIVIIVSISMRFGFQSVYSQRGPEQEGAFQCHIPHPSHLRTNSESCGVVGATGWDHLLARSCCLCPPLLEIIFFHQFIAVSSLECT